jgi:hypothetical protein
LDGWLQRQQTATTIARRIAIDEDIIDARIIGATHGAAAWYSLPQPAQLIGQWISTLQHPADARLGRLLSTARYYGLPMPTRYVCRLRQVPTPGALRAVTKDTIQLGVGSETYWITVLSEATEPPLVGQAERYREALLLTDELKEQFVGRLSVADMQAMLQGRTEPQSHARGGRPLTIALGETVVLDTRLYLHRCARCTGIWLSAAPDPARCGKRPCQQTAWRELPKPFRRMQQHGICVTPQMVREVRHRRRASRGS